MLKTLFATLLLTLMAVNSEISKAIQNNDAKTLATFFNTTVELDMLGEEGNYSKTQAEQIIKKFFTTYPVSSYKVIHTGNAKDGSSFEIGTVVSKGSEFRTYLLLKGTGAAQKIFQFRVEAENE